MTRSHTLQGKGSQYLNKLNTERSIHLVQNSNEGMIYLIPSAKDGIKWLGAKAYQFVLNPMGVLACWKQTLTSPRGRHIGRGTSLNFSSVFLPHMGITHD